MNRKMLIDYDEVSELFDKEFKETMQLIRDGETHLDNLAEGFTEADRVLFKLLFLKPQTNADRIRAMSDEELADFLCSIAYARNTPWSEPFETKFCKSCPTIEATIKETGKTVDLKECDFVDGVCPHGSDAVWWLRQPVKDGDNDG